MKFFSTYDGSNKTPICYIGGIYAGDYHDVLYLCSIGHLHNLLDKSGIDHTLPTFIR